ncbi:MAG TPA: glycosyltransferase [Methylomirabilota bacterium]
MARILITSWGSYGDVYPYVGLALGLRARGHEPVVVMAEFYRALIESLGFEFHPAGPVIDPDDRALIARVMDPVRGSDTLLKDILMPSLRSDYEAIDTAARNVDLMVTHPITFAAPVIAQARRLPWVSTVLAPMSFFSPTDIPVLPPAPFLAHLGRLGPWYGRIIARVARRQTRGWMAPVFDLRRDLGLPPGAHPLFEGQFSPALTLALFSRVLAAPQPDWPANVVVTGFVFYNGPDALPPELDAFLNAGPPPVVFTLGTSAVAAAGSFYEESVDAVKRLGIRAVLLTGGFEQNRPRAMLPPGILLVDRAPHQSLFPRAAAVVHQGGAGTLAQALRAGRPMLVVPHAHDQPDNAARVARRGVARTLLPRAYRGRRVARELDRLLSDTVVAARATEVAAIVRAEGGAGAAAAAIADQFH